MREGQDRPHPHVDFIPLNVCPCLRTKTMHLNTEYRRSEFEERFSADTAIFHCLRTMCSWGPDEEDCTPQSCLPGRECYEGDGDLT